MAEELKGAAQQAPGGHVAAEQARVLLERLRPEQNLIGGLLAGLAASAVGAAVWAVVTDVTGYQIGWMAVGVGFLVGIAVRTVGKGLDTIYGVIGAGLALLGCLAGNLFAVVGLVAQQESLTYVDVLSRLNGDIVMELMTATFSPMDLLFYGIAIYEGYKLSFRRIMLDELKPAAT